MSEPEVAGVGNVPTLAANQKAAQSSSQNSPIVVEVSEFEAYALREAGDAPDVGVQDFVLLKLVAQGANEEQARELAAQVSEAALRARARIEEARRYELKVIPSVPNAVPSHAP